MEGSITAGPTATSLMRRPTRPSPPKSRKRHKTTPVLTNLGRLRRDPPPPLPSRMPAQRILPRSAMRSRRSNSPTSWAPRSPSIAIIRVARLLLIECRRSKGQGSEGSLSAKLKQTQNQLLTIAETRLAASHDRIFRHRSRGRQIQIPDSALTGSTHYAPGRRFRRRTSCGAERQLQPMTPDHTLSWQDCPCWLLKHHRIIGVLFYDYNAVSFSRLLRHTHWHSPQTAYPAICAICPASQLMGE